jgi:PTH1 family peptidyl-tRNA hydrolase
MNEKYLIIGLGNPDRQYLNTRHNIGFSVVDHFARQHGLSFSRVQHQAHVTGGNIAGRSVVLAKPQSYMNLSGGPTSALAKFYKVTPDHLLVVADDLDLPVGTLRLRPSGSSGGQNGLKHIIERLGTEDFPRLRIGIGRPTGRVDQIAYVLQNFTAKQAPIIQLALNRASEAIETWLRDGITLAMSRHNGPTVLPSPDLPPGQESP